MFPAPLVLDAQPTLLGYYRLLYGYSQKQFYTSESGCSRFKSMETKGVVSSGARASLSELCAAFGERGVALLAGVADHLHNPHLFHELSLLTLGAQYRGGANNQRGAAGIRAVFEVIRGIVADSVENAGEVSMDLRNAAGKRVTIVVRSDPDIFIKSHLESGQTRPIVAIEVKAGEDRSNIHNRIGEAEKSHQKARAQGVTECWTVINVPPADIPTLKRESPSTDRFFQLLELTDPASAQFADFRERVRDLVGI